MNRGIHSKNSNPLQLTTKSTLANTPQQSQRPMQYPPESSQHQLILSCRQITAKHRLYTIFTNRTRIYNEVVVPKKHAEELHTNADNSPTIPEEPFQSIKQNQK
ncbi:Hypothetical_protein [Hexamita inflata]|uniref:Hypothetical_protein n=1 Tax=Hexamita inflata TaxID=28002 RepID=A0AA86QAQ8_9EUKA|nr:Hypothetical protein HINF_LOCUS41156 [Hexamita inflata]